jgi:hypothetical protein
VANLENQVLVFLNNGNELILFHISGLSILLLAEKVKISQELGSKFLNTGNLYDLALIVLFA